MRIVPLRLATFNLKDFFVPETEAARAVHDAKVANVAGELRRANADVVALQEVGEPELLERLVHGELADLGYGVPVLGTPDKRGIRCVIASRLPIVWSKVHAPKTLPFPRFFEADPEPFGERVPLRRGVVHVRIDAGALGEVDVITAHFKSNRGVPLRGRDGEDVVDETPRGKGEAAVRSLVQRAAEALFVRGVADDVLRASPDHAVCVLGDLNDTYDSLPVRIVRGIGEPASGVLHGAAERVAPARRFSCLHGGRPVLIDHVLVTERLRAAIADVSIQNDALRDHGCYAADPPPMPDSDHALVAVTITL